MALPNPFKRWMSSPAPTSATASDERSADRPRRGFSRLWGNRRVFGQNTTNASVTPESALSLPVVYACINSICSGLAPLPFRLVQKMPDGSTRQAVEHPLYWKLVRSYDGGNSTPTDFRRSMLLHTLLYGAASIEIIRAGDGSIKLELLDPALVQPLVDEYGDLTYLVGGYKVEKEKLIRINSLGISPVAGLAPTSLAAQAFAIALTADRSAGATLSNAQMASGFLSSPAQTPPEVVQEMLDSFIEMTSGLNAGGVGFLPPGVEFKESTLDTTKSQLLESRRWQVTEICRVFNVPPSKVFSFEGYSYNSSESSNLAFISDCIGPWAEIIEESFCLRLLTEAEQRAGYTFVTDFKGLLRGDSAARSNYYKTMSGLGVLSANDIAILEGFDPFEGGEKHLIPLNMTDSAKPADSEGS